MDLVRFNAQFEQNGCWHLKWVRYFKVALPKVLLNQHSGQVLFWEKYTKPTIWREPEVSPVRRAYNYD